MDVRCRGWEMLKREARHWSREEGWVTRGKLGLNGLADSVVGGGVGGVGERGGAVEGRVGGWWVEVK